jgi:hypothetical protein
MANKTYKQKRQEEEYNKWKRQQRQSEDLFAPAKPAALHINKKCSVCGHIWAWYSSDSGETWQCSTHRKS